MNNASLSYSLYKHHNYCLFKKTFILFKTHVSSWDRLPIIAWRIGFPSLCWTRSGGSDANRCRWKQWSSSSDGSREAGVRARCCGCVSAICSRLPGRPARPQTLAQQLGEPSCMVGKYREAGDGSKSLFSVITTDRASLSKSIKTCCQDSDNLYFGLMEIKNVVLSAHTLKVYPLNEFTLLL